MALLLALALSACKRTPQEPQRIEQGRPEWLSAWGVLLVQDHMMRPSAGVVPYDLNTPLFSDYAHKLRTVWMPKGASAVYDEHQTFEMPVGTIITKTFYYPKAQAGESAAGALQRNDNLHTDLDGEGLDLQRVRLIETRVLVRRAEGWVALPYVWNAEQTDARLQRLGESIPVELVDGAGKRQALSYEVPNENQCAGCHMVQLKNREFRPIGLKARHLNRDFSYAGVSENQLSHLAKLGMLSGLPGADVPRAADFQDPAESLERRARAYLDINCAHCHSPTGPANNTALNLEPFLPMAYQSGLCKPSVAAGKGTGEHLFDVVPGEPDASIMPFRLASTESGVMMPELGRGLVHTQALALIRDWIAAMQGHCDARQQGR
ncbi:MAG: hypothetical protein JOY60_07685 [Burkholderiaceae bacterium]|nr:hypothetical protein [Roseateles sp.]MBV8469722.1 hypothetical protein [Burkholderiaceae bacterium]